MLARAVLQWASLLFVLAIPYFHFKAWTWNRHIEEEEGEGSSLLSRLRLQNPKEQLESLRVEISRRRSGSRSNSENSLRPRNISAVVSNNQLSSPCTLSYPPQCDMYWYVSFWRTTFHKWDCFVSPLSVSSPKQRLLTSGPLHAPATEEPKYVVFEPDRGKLGLGFMVIG